MLKKLASSCCHPWTEPYRLLVRQGVFQRYLPSAKIHFSKFSNSKFPQVFFSWPLTLDLCSPGLHGTFCITLAMKVTVLSHDPFGTNSKVEEWVKSYVISADFFTLKLNFFIEMKVHLCTQPAQEPSTDRGLSWVLTSKSQFLLYFAFLKYEMNAFNVVSFYFPKIVTKFESMSENQWHMTYLHTYIWYGWKRKLQGVGALRSSSGTGGIAQGRSIWLHLLVHPRLWGPSEHLLGEYQFLPLPLCTPSLW